MSVPGLNIHPFILYLGSRGISAAGNFAAVAIFTRIAGTAEYGHYILIYAWSMVVYGFSTQWTRFAYFGTFQSNVDEYVGSLIQLLAAALVILAAGFVVTAAIGVFDPLFLLAIFALVATMTVYEAACEVARSLLHAQAAAGAVILRTFLTIALGSAVLLNGGGATELALVVAAVHAISAIPCFVVARHIDVFQGSRAASIRMLRYGWPLLLSFGVNAVGHSIDRLLLAYYAGPAAIGAYGVLSDVLRQSFTVFGDAIALSLIATAKVQANAGDVEASNQTLRKAFNACMAAGAFGVAFFVIFGDVVTQIVLGQQFVELSRELVPIFAVAFAFVTMRNFYFAQVIYFTHASHLELIVSTMFVVISSALSVLLIPHYGSQGAAISLMVGCVASCLAFALMGRVYYRMPIDLGGLFAIPGLAVAFVLGVWQIGPTFAPAGVLLFVEASIFVVIGVVLIHRLGLLQVAPVNGRD
jgi:O-antigen/teichoic acid export membrane protein